jgi:hypothetical protein
VNVLLFLLFFQFNGKFSGTGTAAYSSGRTYACREIFLSLETNPTLFRLKDGGYKCGDLLHASFDPFRMTIKEGRLFDGNDELGTITDDELKYEIFDPEDGSTYRLKLSMETGKIHYYEEWHDGEKIALKINGLLSPVK